jgi:serine/threonine protein kinase/tetratricopeptide (TPR) repeat protein
MIGRNISHYRILEKLGEGGMGVVYLAEDFVLHRKVALKFFPAEYAADADVLLRFRREAQAAAALSHPHIITVHEVGDHEGRPFIVMAYVEGEELTDAMAGARLSIERAIDIAVEVCDGLSCAHEAGVVHRDIKPGNIRIGKDGRAQILDFGLAKLKGVGKLTKEESTLGTVKYMSPEQAQGQEVDHRADIFSLGVVLYEMITGQLPFRGDHTAAVMYSITNEDPHPLGRFSREASDELERIVRKALAKNPSERYQSARDMMVDLRTLRSAARNTRFSVRSKHVKSKRKIVIPALALVAAVALAIAIIPRVFTSSTPSEESVGIAERKMIVVLPFENLGPSESEYFADGITEEITSRLAALSGLGVISRTSAFQYKGAKKPIKQIGDELGVDYVLEGTVRWNKPDAGESRVRVTPQLICVADDTHLWSDRYDRVLRDIFSVQSEIANHVIDELNVTLLEPERRAVEAQPTTNMEAYQAYLRGLDNIKRALSLEQSRLAIQMFEWAVTLDSTFALAYAALSRAHGQVVITGIERTQEHIVKAKAAVDRAIELQPESPEVYLALGYYYYNCLRDYNQALEAFDAVGERLPNQNELFQLTGFIRRRQGQWDEALDNLKRALELNPRDSHLNYEIGITCFYLRRYSEADDYFNRAIALAPDEVSNYVFKAYSYIKRADNARAKAILEKMPVSNEPFAHYAWYWQEMNEQNYQAALRHVAALPDEPFELGAMFFAKAQLEGIIYSRMGEPERALEALAFARDVLEREINMRPKDARIHSSLGQVYMALDRKEDAIRQAELAVEMLPVSEDALQGPMLLENLIRVYLAAGEYKAALDQLDYLLSIPSLESVTSVRASYECKRLRDHPRFQAILEKYSKQRQ